MHLFMLVEVPITKRIIQSNGNASFCNRSGTVLQLFVLTVELVNPVDVFSVLHSCGRRKSSHQKVTKCHYCGYNERGEKSTALYTMWHIFLLVKCTCLPVLTQSSSVASIGQTGSVSMERSSLRCFVHTNWNILVVCHSLSGKHVSHLL